MALALGNVFLDYTILPAIIQVYDTVMVIGVQYGRNI